MKHLSVLLLAVLFALAVFSPDVDACSRRRNNRPPNVIINRVPLPPFIRPMNPTPNMIITQPVPRPTPPPTPRPTTVAPTAVPTATPTAIPTSEPTPPPPPVSRFGLIAPTPPGGTTVQMERPKCLKSSEFRRQNDGQIKEEWTYACSFNIYVTVDLGTITEPTPCACGVKLDNPSPNTGTIPSNMTTQVDFVRLVVYDEVTKKVKGNIDNFPFWPDLNVTKELIARAASTDAMDYSAGIAGFAAVAKPFNGATPLLDKNLPGQQGHVPAVCFQVTQTFTTRYQWPEPPLPKMHEAPNIFATTCQPNRTPPNQMDVTFRKRQIPAGVADYQWFRDFLIFSRNVQTGGFVSRNRYITSYYYNSECSSGDGFVSFDRQFNSEITRGSSNGLFRWNRAYTDVHIIAGVPKSFSTVTNYLSDGYYKVSWTQTYNYKGDGIQGKIEAPGLLRAALLGISHPDCNQHCGKTTKLCTSIPEPWTPTRIADKLDNEDPANLAIFPSQGIDCQPNFRRCDGETTWLAFQNFGASARDFSKLRGSHLFTGPRTLFCSSIVTQVLDTLEFKPLDIAKMLRKRGEADSLSVSKRSIFDVEHIEQSALKPVGGDSRLAIPTADPVLEAIPQPSELRLQAATGTVNAEGKRAGDHPVDFFKEAYTAPISVKQEDTSCGSFTGGVNGVDDYCIAGELAQRPPCLPGQRGCSCRSGNSLKCDLGLTCSETNFCIGTSCPPGNPGCKCNADKSCRAGLTCGPEDICFHDSSNKGQLGFACAANEGCNAGNCSTGVCIAGSGEGTPGASCRSSGQACDNGFICQSDMGVCVSPNLCNTGAPGCDCNNGLCAQGQTCKSNGMCGLTVCTPGEIGCPCLPGDQCSKTGVKCRSPRADGADKACFGEALCTTVQSERCRSYCGDNNVMRCPSCSYQAPQCFVTVESSAPAAPTAGLFVMIVFALLALLF